MSRFYFDYRDNGNFVQDKVGTRFTSSEEAKIEASKAMTEFARDMLSGAVERTLAIEVRDDTGPLLRVTLHFEVE